MTISMVGLSREPEGMSSNWIYYWRRVDENYNVWTGFAWMNGKLMKLKAVGRGGCVSQAGVDHA